MVSPILTNCKSQSGDNDEDYKKNKKSFANNRRFKFSDFLKFKTSPGEEGNMKSKMQIMINNNKVGGGGGGGGRAEVIQEKRCNYNFNSNCSAMNYIQVLLHS